MHYGKYPERSVLNVYLDVDTQPRAGHEVGVP